jgi:hypothetical protein
MKKLILHAIRFATRIIQMRQDIEYKKRKEKGKTTQAVKATPHIN